MAADILHIDKRPVHVAQHAAMDGTGAEIQAWRGVDGPAQRHKLRGAKPHVGIKANLPEPFHHIAVGGALCAAARADPALHLRLKIGLTLGSHNDHAKIVIMVDSGDDIIVMKHVLVQEIADGEFRRPVTDGHRGDDLLAVQIKGQRLFRDHGQGHQRAGFINACHRLRQAGGVRVRSNDHRWRPGVLHAAKMAELPASNKPQQKLFIIHLDMPQMRWPASGRSQAFSDGLDFAFQSQSRYPAPAGREQWPPRVRTGHENPFLSIHP